MRGPSVCRITDQPTRSAVKLNDPAKVLAWLQKKPGAEELRNAFPAEWDAIEQALANAIGERDPARLNRLLSPPSFTGKRSLGKREKAELVQQAIKQRMAALAIEHYSLAIATGTTSGRIRFNLFNGLLAQWLLFKKGLERKPVSMERAAGVIGNGAGNRFFDPWNLLGAVPRVDGGRSAESPGRPLPWRPARVSVLLARCAASPARADRSGFFAAS